MEIYHINKSDIRGGAGRFANALHRALNKRGHSSFMLVDRKFSPDNRVIELSNDKYRTKWYRLFSRIATYFLESGFKGSWVLFKVFRFIAFPGDVVLSYLGVDNFHHPGLKKVVLNRGVAKDCVFQVYAAHGNYLDLSFLQKLSLKYAVVMRMPDAWLLSGHCAHSFECLRWKSGCGKCPDLTIPPKVNRDSTRYNWREKQRLFRKSRFHVVTPSHWLMEKVKESMLLPAAATLSVIPNGVDVDTFCPGDKILTRSVLRIDQGAFVLLFSANGLIGNRWKDYALLKDALRKLSDLNEIPLLILIGLGDSGTHESLGNAKVVFIKYVEDASQLANYYRCADLYIHPTKADSFPNSVLEAMACGLPVVATAVGGIVEQVKPLFWNESTLQSSYELDEATGILVPESDSIQLVESILYLYRNEESRLKLGENARADVLSRFSLNRVTDDYLKLYQMALSANS